MEISAKPPVWVRLWWWLVNDERHTAGLTPEQHAELDKFRVGVFVILHLAVAAVFVVGVSWPAVAAAAGSYLLRMFFVTAFFHRYFSHRSFQTHRLTQFIFAVLGCTAGQRGPLWWASHHRAHHHHADTADDPHSPDHRGMWFAHSVWFLTRGSFGIEQRRVRDWLRYPELRWLEKFDWLPFIAFGIGCYWLGEFLGEFYPQSGASGWQVVVWAFVVATVVLYHATYTVNSLAHRYGSRRYQTDDSSRNNLWLALLTLGEGWHNNHHRYPAAARQGFFWWELDVTYLLLRILSWLGVIRDLRTVPASLLAEGAR